MAIPVLFYLLCYKFLINAMHHFFVGPEQVLGDGIRIVGPDVNHMKNVLRMKPGEQVLISDGTGKDYTCSIISIDSEAVEAGIRSVSNEGSSETRLSRSASTIKNWKPFRLDRYAFRPETPGREPQQPELPSPRPLRTAPS